MRKCERADIGAVFVGDGLEAEVGELGRDFGGAFRGFGFDDQGVRAWGFLER